MRTKKTSSKTKKSSAKTMEELLAFSGFQMKSFSPGDKFTAKLIKLGKSSATFDIGGKSEGAVIDSYFDEAKGYLRNLAPGDEVEVEIVEPETADGAALISVHGAALDEVWDELESLKIKEVPLSVEGQSTSSAGVVVEVKGLSGFIPKSQLGAKAARKMENLVGKIFEAKIIELDKASNKIVLSERLVSEAGEIKLQKDALEAVKVGEVYEGKVVKLTNFGAFVEVKVKVAKKQIPIEGLVHVSELAWEKVDDPASVLSVDDKVKVKVIEFQGGKLALSIKAALEDPWNEIEKKYKKDQKVKGKVTRKSGFGVFVALEPGIEGLIHITKIPPGKRLETGEEVACFIEEINKKERRISLGLVLTAKPVGYK